MSAFVVAGPVGYVGRPGGCAVNVHNCPLDEATIYPSEWAAVRAQQLERAAGGVGLTVHEVDARWVRSKRAGR